MRILILICIVIQICCSELIVEEVGRCFLGKNNFTHEVTNGTLIQYQCNYFIFYKRVNSTAVLEERNRTGLIIVSVVLLLFFILPCCLVCLHSGCNSKNRNRILKFAKIKTKNSSKKETIQE